MAEKDGRIPSEGIAEGSPPLTGALNNVPRTDPAASRVKALLKAPAATATAEPKDSLREVVETIVFVVVLVLLLKSFVAEAFVIPTGSMAETLYGYQKMVVCPKCQFKFPVNCSCEVDPQQGEPPAEVIGCTCPNCRYQISFADDFTGKNKVPSWSTGDRVLVGKYFYDLGVGGLNSPSRYQVVVFKYPKEPQKGYTPLNYIKRLIGLPGETIAIHYGKLYSYEGLNYDDFKEAPEVELWQQRYMHDNDAETLFKDHKFRILRKPPKQVLAERRIVFDNDHQPNDLKGKVLTDDKVRTRWQAAADDGAWTADDKDEPKVFRHEARQGGEVAWLRYHHLIPSLNNRNAVRPELITDFMGYNTFVKAQGNPHTMPAPNWVGDLMLECNVDIQQSQGELVFELSKGHDRFRARFDLASGQCALIRVANDDAEQELDSKPTSMTKAGKYTIRFANVDERLLVWVNSSLPFGDGVNYAEPRQRGPWAENDLKRPAGIGVKNGTVTVSELKLWRDTYYTVNINFSDASPEAHFDQPETWDALRDLPVRTLYVQPNHFLCLGDNSRESSDGRSWGTVPKRLMLGRALMIYYPLNGRAGRIE